MPAVKAHVKNGRLLVDEPTDFPDGETIELVPLDEVLANGGDYLDEEDRQRLHDSPRESIVQERERPLPVVDVARQDAVDPGGGTVPPCAGHRTTDTALDCRDHASRLHRTIATPTKFHT
jgi:hypothetical protein